jgi:Flp pilus assembly protein TadG
VRQHGERGSIAIELAFLAPVVLLIMALIWGYGRVAWANGHLEAGARDAARVATQARSLPEAQAAAERAVRGATAAVPACQSSVRVTISGRFQPGETITVDASCSYPLGDIGLPGAPGRMNPTSTFSSVLDLHRGVTEGRP